MSRSGRDQRRKRLGAWLRELPPEERGKWLSVLWVNSLVTVALQGALLTIVVRAGLRGIRNRASGPHVALLAAWSPSLPLLVGMNVAHQLARHMSLRTLENRINRGKP